MNQVDIESEQQRLRQCLESRWQRCAETTNLPIIPPGQRKVDVWFLRCDASGELVVSHGTYDGRWFTDFLNHKAGIDVPCWKYRYVAPAPELPEGVRFA